MTGYIHTRKPRTVSISSKEKALEMLSDNDTDFDLDEDVVDEETAGYVHDALLEMMHINDGKNRTIGTEAERNWILESMKSLSERWQI